VRVRNVSNEPLRIRDIRFVDANGTFVNSASSASDLTKQPNYRGEYLADTAVTMAPTAAGMIGGGAVFMPLAIIGLAVNLFSGFRAAEDADDEKRLAALFSKQSLQSVLLDQKGEATGLAFLPLIQNPRLLALEYEHEGRVKYLRLPIPSVTTVPPRSLQGTR